MITTQAQGLFSKASIRSVALLILAAIAIGLGGTIYLGASSRANAAAVNSNSLQTTKAVTGDLVVFAKGTGKIQAAGESSFGFNTSGQVSAIDVKIGDHAEAGQVLAQLDDTNERIELASAQDAMDKLISAAAIATARQSIAEAETSLAGAQATLEHLISPEVLYWEEKVAEREQILTDAKAASQTDTSDAAKQKVAQAVTSLKYAQDSLEYFQRVYEETYVPKTFTQYRTMTFRGRTTTEVVKIEDATTGNLVDLIYPPTEGEIRTARADYDSAKAAVAEAQTYLDVLNGAEIPEGATGANLVTYLQSKHALATAEYNLEATKLIAPISGTVTALDINVGDTVNTGNTAITISNLDQPYAIDAFLDAKDWGQAHVGDEVDVTFDILPEKVFKGIVTGVYPTLDTTSSNSALVHFTARLNESIPYELPSGSSAEADVIGGRAQNAVLVPVPALHKIGEDKYFLFVVENGKLHLRSVVVGLQDLTRAQIISGLNAGDVVSTGIVRTK